LSYLSSKWKSRDEHELAVGIGETVIIHWNITNPHGEDFYLRGLDLNGNTLLEKKVPSSGIFADPDSFETVDFILERDEGSTRTSLGSLRITALH
jgi:hypothetical protein